MRFKMGVNFRIPMQTIRQLPVRDPSGCLNCDFGGLRRWAVIRDAGGGIDQRILI